MGPIELSGRIKAVAANLGLERCGIAPSGITTRAPYLMAWLESGRHGTMDYLTRNLDLRIDPARLLDGAKSIIVVALQYHQPLPRVSANPSAHAAAPQGQGIPNQGTEGANAGAPRGKVAMYAWGDDYHDVLRNKLKALVRELKAIVAQPFETRICVDTAPILERDWAAAAGVGWIGKNTLVLHEGLGSYFFLGTVLTTLELIPDEPAVDHCGTCRACLDACPTSAFPAPYEMDAARCISYLTIEHRGAIAAEFHESMGAWVFGCDVCQEVCPHNRHAASTQEPRFAVREPTPRPDLNEMMSWTEDDYRVKLKGSAMKRATPEMLRRNARIASGNAIRRAPGDG